MKDAKEELCSVLSNAVPTDPQSLLVTPAEEPCALGNPQPFHELLTLTGEPRQHIPSRQASFAHQHLSEQLLQLLGWNSTPLFQKIYQQTKQNALSDCLYFQVTLYGLCIQTWILNSFLPTHPSSQCSYNTQTLQYLPFFCVTGALCSLASLLTSIISNLILLLLHWPSCAQSWFSL